MSSKHLTNSVRDCVRESLQGFAAINPHLHVDLVNQIVYDAAEIPRNGRRVGIVSGGGSGHEPFPSGFVGSGMLTASVCGSIFTSPSSKQILQAIRLVSNKFSEVLLIIPNYTGDVLNFGLAAETAIRQKIAVESLYVGEDIAQECHDITTKAGKRGTSGLLLIAKIAGYLAEKGKCAKEIKKECSEVAKEMASIGLCLNACTKPGGGILFHLKENETELGIGVHGEAGVARMVLTSAKRAVECLLFHLKSFLKIHKGDELIILINNLGSLSHLEQWLVAGEVQKQLTEEGIQVIRLYADFFLTSLNMNGVQICCLKLNGKQRKLIIDALSHPTDAPAWPRTVPFDPQLLKVNLFHVPKIKEENWDELVFDQPTISPETCQIFEKCLIQSSESLIDAEASLNWLDSICGDGDCGTTFRSLAEAILTGIKNKKFKFSKPSYLFSQLSDTAMEVGGGTTSAIYGLFFKGISKELENFQSFEDSTIYRKCWRAGVETIKKYSSARLGDRTMLDALEPGCMAFEETVSDENVKALEAFKMALAASKEGCLKTKTLRARAGRASYTDSSKQTEADAGAKAVTIWLSAILHALERCED